MYWWLYHTENIFPTWNLHKTQPRVIISTRNQNRTFIPKILDIYSEKTEGGNFWLLTSGWMQALCNSILCSSPREFGQFLQLGLPPFEMPMSQQSWCLSCTITAWYGHRRRLEGSRMQWLYLLSCNFLIFWFCRPLDSRVKVYSWSQNDQRTIGTHTGRTLKISKRHDGWGCWALNFYLRIDVTLLLS